MLSPLLKRRVVMSLALALSAVTVTEVGLVVRAEASTGEGLATKLGPLAHSCDAYQVTGYDRDDYKEAWCTGSPAAAGDPILLSVIDVDGKPVEVAAANAYLIMAEAAANDPVNPVNFVLEAGYRSIEKQMQFWQCDQCVDAGQACGSCTYDLGDGPQTCTSCNDAACPGKSRHHLGVAVDIQTGCSQFSKAQAHALAAEQGSDIHSEAPWAPQVEDCKAKSLAFTWLMEHANAYGFFRTYKPEAWHWVYQPWINPGPGGGPCDGGSDVGAGAPTSPLSSQEIAIPDTVNTKDGFMDTDSEYLARVVHNEMGWVPTSWYPGGSTEGRHEALQAQAIAARTYLMFHVQSLGLDDQVPNSEGFQTYCSPSSQHCPAAFSRAAAEATQGLVLTWQNDLITGHYASGAWPIDDQGNPLPPVEYGIDQKGASPNLTWDEVRELRASGQLTDLGSDGYSWTWIYVTQNQGKSGDEVIKTPKPNANPIAANRGALGQYRALWLAHKEGMNAMNILRYFYGDDIDLANGGLPGEAPVGSGAPSGPSQSPAPLSPDNDAVVPDGSATLSWQAVPGATEYQIGIWYVDSAGELSWYTTQSLGDVQEYEFTPLANAGAFRYKVRALSHGHAGPWSSWATFQFEWWCADGDPSKNCECPIQCDGKECGPDSCGGSCGDCSLLYTPQFACFDGVCDCQPSCDGKECGPDGCGGSCGDCALLYSPSFSCEEGLCACQPNCDGKECGSDGCGGSCGDCSLLYSPSFSCQGGLCGCMPNCNGKECGPDGCGGSCGDCSILYSPSFSCQAGVCDCMPICDGKECGSDGCGGSCGDCSILYNPSFSCKGGVCDCMPNCDGKECGSDGCGGSCGDCEVLYTPSFTCQAGVCGCPGNCTGKTCGSDGCGGSCGSCGNGGACQAGSCSCTKKCLDSDTLLNSDCTTSQCAPGQTCQVVGPPGGGGTSACN